MTDEHVTQVELDFVRARLRAVEAALDAADAVPMVNLDDEGWPADYDHRPARFINAADLIVALRESGWHLAQVAA